MSPSDPSPWQPPRPGSTPPPPPPPASSAPPPPVMAPPPGYPVTDSHRFPPGYPATGYGTPPPMYATKPPRPAAPVGGALMIAGAVIAAVGCFLPWLEFGGSSIDGFDEGPDEAALGGGVIFFALVLIGMGITTLAAKRILPIAIIGIVAAALCLVVSAVQLADYSDFADAFGADLGAGLPVVVLGSLVALAGAIITCAKRRTW